ncbi:MAG: GAF domain-containing protein [Candidatus Krumholzibacteria bacterium]|nr:GAF domain-containing protein [Candidatus Krumholzibacteria bacterium]
MKHTERTVTELASLFRMIQVIPDAESIARIYQMLLAFCTTWRTIGFQRAFLFLVDSKARAVRGHLAADRTPFDGDAETVLASSKSFEALAKSVFENYEQIESSDLTLHTRTLTVPLDWHRSAVVKAVLSGFPVLADGRMSEFATDPLFGHFGTSRYIAIPIKVGGRVLSVLAADNGPSEQEIQVSDVSLVYSLAQQSALAIERLLEASDNRRKFRILRKLQEIMRGADSSDRLADAINLSLSMICRAVDGSGILLQDLARGKTIHVKTVDEFTVEADDADVSVAESFEGILSRAAGTLRPVRGDARHALLDEAAAGRVRFFHAVPLAAAGTAMGALAVYVGQDQGDGHRSKLHARDGTFLELCAGTIGDRLAAQHRGRELARAESMLEEVQSNLVRERQTARTGERATEYHRSLQEGLSGLDETLRSRLPMEKRVARAKELLSEIQRDVSEQRDDLDSMRSSLELVDLFALVAEVTGEWKPRAEKNGVEVTVRVPRRGPSLLMSRESVRGAVENILRTLTSSVVDGDKVLVECSATQTKAIVCIADTGAGIAGNMLSRLFMPFSGGDEADDHKRAMSLAGDILHRHGAEILVKSSPSWKTILLISFPSASNRDRRRARAERRRRAERRAARA